jgi:hypothetical protein
MSPVIPPDPGAEPSLQYLFDFSPESPRYPHTFGFDGDLKAGVNAAAEDAVDMAMAQPGREVGYLERLPCPGRYGGDLFLVSVDIRKDEGAGHAEPG